MRQSGPFEYQDLEEVTKWDSKSEVPGGKWRRRNSGRKGRSEENGGGGRFRNVRVFRCKWRRGKVPEREGVRVQMVAGEGSGT